MKKHRKHLLIPDAHARPNESLRRFEWLGKLIIEEQPDVIIDIGDWFDMESLSSYDKGTKSFEGRRYKADIKAGHDADMAAFGPILEYNERQRANRKKLYTPTIIRTTGNHEHRIARAVEKQPELDGAIGLPDLISPIEEHLDVQRFDFLSPVLVDGVAYCHYFVSGVMGRPVSSAQAMLAKHHMSCSAGHLHSRDWSEGLRADGTRIQGLICGAYLDPDHRSHYTNEQSQSLWWSGIHIKDNVFEGNYDRTELSVERLKERYA